MVTSAIAIGLPFESFHILAVSGTNRRGLGMVFSRLGSRELVELCKEMLPKPRRDCRGFKSGATYIGDLYWCDLPKPRLDCRGLKSGATYIGCDLYWGATYSGCALFFGFEMGCDLFCFRVRPTLGTTGPKPRTQDNPISKVILIQRLWLIEERIHVVGSDLKAILNLNHIS